MIRKIFTITILFMFIENSYSMSITKNTENNLPNGMSSYTLQISGSNIMNFQGIIAYYDNLGEPKTESFNGSTPYNYYFQSKEGVSAFLRISQIQPVNTFGSVLRVVLFKGNEFVAEKRSLITDNSLYITYGKYPNIDLEFMMLPDE